MDEQGFRTMLEGRKVPPDKMDSALALAERFEQFAAREGGYSAETAWAFSRQLIGSGENSLDNYYTLARYGLFIRNNAVYIAILELLDGCEAQENLYHRVAERYGETLRDDVFAGIGLAPLGLPTPEKPRTMQPVIERLEKVLGAEPCRLLLNESLRDLPEELYREDRTMYEQAGSVDGYIIRRKERFLSRLETCQREGRLFFAQEITDAVLDFVRSQPEIGGGVRQGNIVYETKIPFMTGPYLVETDPLMKRYYYCHCPWAREAVRRGEQVAPIFCNCSAGFHRKPWEAALGQKVDIEVITSVLSGDTICRFAIHLPDRSLES